MQKIYDWMKNVAIFYILLTAVQQMIPVKKYERYIRFFMGLLLILMMSIPVMSLLRYGEEISEEFWKTYQIYQEELEEMSQENIQKFYLEEGYEKLLGDN